MTENSRILVVEDDPVGQIIILEMLKKLGFQADMASNGGDAVKLASGNFYDLVLMDCYLPVMDGLQATGKIRKMERSKNRIKNSTIVALTAKALTGDRELCLKTGMDDYLSKPIEMEDLRQILTKYLS